MYLNKLEINGFKSFPNKTVFNFAPGITAVVGPNGCGKTNVVDAIRWALGEQKTTVLRSDNMENVIFNGAGSRKPQSMAEVSISLENTKKLLPVEYSEVVVTRRLFRDGDSAYLLNKTQCRLKDIIDLFLDTGMGANSYSVIELKMVEAILSGKAEERRRLIEEAAGINKYKIRRKEAVRKLAYVQNDLVRVHDIVLEVEKQVRSLQRQSAKTNRYNKLNLELLSLQKELISYNFVFYNKDLVDYKNKLNDLVQQKIKSEQILTDNENFVKTLENNNHKLTDLFVNAQDEENQIKDEISSLNENYAVSNQKIISNENKIDRIKREIDELQNSVNELETAEKVNQIKIESLEKDVSEQTSALKNHVTVRDEASNNVSESRKGLSSKNEEIINLRNRIESIQNSHEKSEGRKRFLSEKIDESNREIEKLNNDMKAIETEIEENDKNISSLRQHYDELEEQKTTFTSKRNAITGAIEELKQNLADLRVVIAKKNSEHEFISNLAIDDTAANSIIKHKNWKPKKKNFLIELIDSDDEYKPAIEAALGGYSNAILVDSHADVLSGISILESESLGKAGFISRDRIPQQLPEHISSKQEGVISFVSELPGLDEDIKNVLRILLDNVVIVKDIDSGMKFVNSNPGSRAVTLRGEVIDSSGYIKGGSLSKKEGISVGKTQRLNKINAELEKLNKEHENGNIKLDSLQKELNQYNIERLLGEIKQMETDIFFAEKNGSQLSYNLQGKQSSIENVNLNIKNFESELNDIGNEKTESDSQLVSLTEEIEQKKIELIEINKSLAAAEADYNEKAEFVKNIELDITRIQTELSHERRESSRLKSEIENKRNKIVNSAEEIEAAMLDIKELRDSSVELDSELKNKAEIADSIRTKREQLQSEKKELEAQIETADEEVRISRKNLDNLREDVHKMELSISELKSKLERVIEDNDKLENERVDLDNVVVPEEFNPEETKAAIIELKNKLTALGMVNFMALDEYEKEKEREEFYHKQVKDLTDSEKTLQDTIKEINDTAEDLFLITFEDIREHFKKLFKTLFSDEGESDLKLVDENVLECDIEIIAKPPGKKPHSIDLLSGGEKTLTSIAFLFAIYLVKPSPFCILDEVDAPLDDANIDKFISMLRDFSESTQFLVVTHNKRTMEAADTMYGITQQEEGVSKIVSVRMND